MSVEKLYYTNENMKIDLLKLVGEIRAEALQPHYIVGITRGGLVPATYLSHALDVPLLTMRFSLRDHAYQERFEYIIKCLKEGKRLLFVDDICDEGETLAQIWDIIREKTGDEKLAWTFLKSAVLINNLGQSHFKPDYSGTEINKTITPVWVVFPWEDVNA
jgi:hypoxanthine phosphoribosyltransferase